MLSREPARYAATRVLGRRGQQRRDVLGLEHLGQTVAAQQVHVAALDRRALDLGLGHLRAERAGHHVAPREVGLGLDAAALELGAQRVVDRQLRQRAAAQAVDAAVADVTDHGVLAVQPQDRHRGAHLA
jgi:hypothetical protein